MRTIYIFSKCQLPYNIACLDITSLNNQDEKSNQKLIEICENLVNLVDLSSSFLPTPRTIKEEESDEEEEKPSTFNGLVFFFF